MAPQAGSVAAALPYGNYLGGIALKGGSQHEKNSLRSQGVIIARPSTKKGTGSFRFYPGSLPTYQEQPRELSRSLIPFPLEVSGSREGMISKFNPGVLGIRELRFIYIPFRNRRSPWHDSAPQGPALVPPPRGRRGTALLFRSGL